MEKFITWYTTNKHYILAGIILISAIILSRIMRRILTKYFAAASKRLRVDPTRYKFFKNTVSLLIFIIAAISLLFIFPSLKALALTLFAGAGILAAILGFASQQAFSNIVSGIFIVVFKPFRVGDRIKVGSFDYGVVEDITLRHTVIKSFQNKHIIIPNSVISSETIVNDDIEDEKICRFVEMGISYDSNMDKAIAIIQEEAAKHPKCIDNRTRQEIKEGVPKIVVRVIGFGDSSINLRAYVWARDPIEGFEMHCDLNKSIKERFDQAGVEIPFPYRTIVYKEKAPKPPNS